MTATRNKALDRLRRRAMLEREHEHLAADDEAYGTHVVPDFTDHLDAARDEAEIDHLWEQLQAGGGREKACGWVEDAWGLSWQIIPRVWFDMVRDRDDARVQRVFQAVWQMQKIDIATLQAAYNGN